MSRGVDIYIAYGWAHPSSPQPEKQHQTKAKEIFRTTIDWGNEMNVDGRLFLADFPNHQKFLISDDQFVACGSHNWLSNNMYSNAERSYVYRSRVFVQAERDRAIEEVRRHHISFDGESPSQD
jgi:phosphatidylserine/phosphatidylglycerophosphate/cardiolipin synthase-like enzyme